MLRRGMPVDAKIVGAAVFAVLAASLSFALVSHRGLPGRHYNYATAAFAELPAALRRGDDVRVSGVRVGQVHGIDYVDGEARVRLQLPGDLEVHGDATARVRSRSSLGQKFVEIDPGTKAAGALGEGVIGQDRTHSLTELDQVLSALDPRTRAALASTVRELGAGAGGRAEDINDLMAAAPDLLADMGTTFGALADDRARLVAFLVASERLAGRFTGREAELEALIDEMGRTFDALSVEDGRPLREAIERLPASLDALQPALAELGEAASTLAGGVHEFAPAARALGAATPDLRAALRESVPTLRSTPPVNRLTAPAFSALAGTLTDARPLAPALRRGIGLLRRPVEILSPYAPELSLVFDNLRDALGQGDSNGNYLRIVSVLAGADNYTGTVPADNPLVNRNPYPAPGEAPGDAQRFEPLGSRP